MLRLRYVFLFFLFWFVQKSRKILLRTSLILWRDESLMLIREIKEPISGSSFLRSRSRTSVSLGHAMTAS